MTDGVDGRFEVTRTAPNHYAVKGPLTFATARRALTSGIEAFTASSADSSAAASTASSTGPIEVDCAGVGAADSAGLAVLIEWLAWARRSGRELRYSSVPEAISAIARLSEVDGLLQQH